MTRTLIRRARLRTRRPWPSRRVHMQCTPSARTRDRSLSLRLPTRTARPCSWCETRTCRTRRAPASAPPACTDGRRTRSRLSTAGSASCWVPWSGTSRPVRTCPTPCKCRTRPGSTRPSRTRIACRRRSGTGSRAPPCRRWCTSTRFQHTLRRWRGSRRCTTRSERCHQTGTPRLWHQSRSHSCTASVRRTARPRQPCLR